MWGWGCQGGGRGGVGGWGWIRFIGAGLRRAEEVHQHKQAEVDALLVTYCTGHTHNKASYRCRGTSQLITFERLIYYF